MSNKCFSDERMDIYGVAYGCPAGERRDNCLLKDFDNLSFKEKVDWINALTEDDIEKIIEHHKSCSSLRSHR